MKGSISRALAALLAAAGFLCAQQQPLLLQVSGLNGKPLAGVTLRGDGEAATSDKAGRLRLPLSADAKPGTWVRLSAESSPRAWIVLEPWDGLIRVPARGKESPQPPPVSVTVAEAGSQQLLESPKALAAIAAHVLYTAAPYYRPGERPSPSRAEAVAEEAPRWKLDAAALRTALDGFAGKASDPLDLGLAALYTGNFQKAAADLAVAYRNRDKQLTRDPVALYQSALFLGQALYEGKSFEKAADALRRTLTLRGGDARVLTAAGLALSNSGKPDAGIPYLEMARELERAR